MSVSELASHCDASQATIIRFCKKIGCKGFHQLKIKLAGEQRQQEEQVISNEIDIDQMDKSLNNIMISKVEEIKATFHNFNPEELREIVDLIIHANLMNSLRWEIRSDRTWMDLTSSTVRIESS